MSMYVSRSRPHNHHCVKMTHRLQYDEEGVQSQYWTAISHYESEKAPSVLAKMSTPIRALIRS